MTIVGRVVELTRYPVKSMAGEALTLAQVDWQGIEGDRQYGFYRTRDRTRFPWLSARDLSGLVRYRPRFRDPDAPRTAPVEVHPPDGPAVALDDPALRARISGEAGAEVALLQVARGLYDAMPVSIVSTATFAAVDAAHGAALDRRRFRANIVIDSDMPESAWRGRRLAFADGAALLVADAIPRCALITIDPDNGARDPAILRTVAQRFGNRVGVYASPARIGSIAVGDIVSIGAVDVSPRAPS